MNRINARCRPKNWPEKLDLSYFPPHNFGRLKIQTAKKMSIITGVISKEGILLGADSRIIDPATGLNSNVEKIKVVMFGGDHVVIGSAGLVNFTNRIIEKTKELAVGKVINSKEDVISVIEEAIRLSKSPLDEQQVAYMEKHGAEMIVAFYANGAPFLLRIDPMASGIIETPEKSYCSAGIGSYLAGFLFGEYVDKVPSSDIALATTIYIIRKVKDTTAYCGGQTQVVMVSDRKRVSISQHVAGDYINFAEKKILGHEARTREHSHRSMDYLLWYVGDLTYKKHLRRVERLEKRAKTVGSKAGKKSK